MFENHKSTISKAIGKKSYIVIDTETNVPDSMYAKDSEGNFILDENGDKIKIPSVVTQKLAFDIAWCVYDFKGNLIVARNYIVKEFFNDATFIGDGYNKYKYPKYQRKIEACNVELKPFLKVYERFQRDCEKFDVGTIWAYNARFDYTVLSENLESFGILSGWMPMNMWADIMPYAIGSVCVTKTYLKWVKKHNRFTDTGKPQTRADALIKYWFGLLIDEDHEALSDVYWENQILQKLRAYNRKPDYRQGWKVAYDAYLTYGLDD